MRHPYRYSLQALFLVYFAGFCCASRGAEYYVSPSGNNDSGNGTSGKPWQTISYSITQLDAGDTLHLEAGATFQENVYFGPGDGGTLASPVVLTSDPTNRPALDSPDAGREGILIWNTAGVVIENLIVTGPGAGATAKIGLAAMTDNGHYEGLTFRNLDVSGYHQGLCLFGYGAATYGFSHVLIEDSYIHHNLANGGMTWAEGMGAMSNVTVRACRFAHNPGDPAENKNSGSGWVFGQVVDGLIEYCVAHDNGGDGNATEGPVGLWAYDSSRVTIQFCESYANKAKHMDGDGFDFDQNVTDSVIQYCYSHDNYGAGYLLCHGGSMTWSNNTIRYCISEDDGYGGKMGSIHYYSAASGLDNAKVYANTVFNSKAPAVWIHQANNTTGAKVWNNVFVTTGGKKLVKGSVNPDVIQFQNNCYWAGAAAFDVAGYTSLADWRAAKGQEILSGAPVGLEADPELNDPGNGGVVDDASQLHTLDAYKLKGTSVLIDRGLDLNVTFGIDPGAGDFFGAALPQCAGFDIGACESPDVDGDLMPDDWETMFLGDTGISSGALTEDWDKDGFCDLHEFLAGTDPTSAASLLVVSGFRFQVSGGEMVIEWQSVSNRTYAIQLSTNLSDGFTQTVAGGIPADPPANVHTTAVSHLSQCFCRVVVE